MTTLPDEIGELKELVRLNVGNHHPTVLSSHINISINSRYRFEHRKFPDAVSDLTELEYFYLSDNHLKVLPTSINKLENLKAQRLDKNQLTDLHSICE